MHSIVSELFKIFGDFLDTPRRTRDLLSSVMLLRYRAFFDIPVTISVNGATMKEIARAKADQSAKVMAAGKPRTEWISEAKQGCT